MKILLLLSLVVFGLTSFADDNIVQPTPSDNGKKEAVDNSSESAIVPSSPDQQKQLEENKKVHEDHLKNQPKAKAKAKAKGHAKKAAKPAHKAKSKAKKKSKH